MKGRKKQSKNWLVILLILLLVLVGAGYAAFRTNIIISGTVSTAEAEFDIQITKANVHEGSAVGVNAEDLAIVVDSNKHTATITVQNLQYPGAGAAFDLVIENMGSLPAEITDIKAEGLPLSSPLKFSGLEELDEEHDVLNPGDKCNNIVSIYWDPEAEDGLEDPVSFTLKVTYDGVTEEFTPITPNHNDTAKQ